jgi:ATP-binding cassette subfamily B (MDR/TAP) protein 1
VYHETFAPVAKIVSLRILLTLIAIFSLYVGGLDCKTAFLNAVLNEVVWLQPPKELIDYLIEIYKTETDPILRKRLRHQITNLRLGALLRLKKALYGTKQAPREWYLMIDKFLKKHGFVSNKADHCFYTLIIDSNNYVFLLLYVDDIIVAATTEELRSKYMKLIAKTFKISYSGELREYLNIRIDHDREKRTVYMSQERYIVEMMEQFDLQPDSKINTPMQENLKVRLQEGGESDTSTSPLCAEIPVSTARRYNLVSKYMHTTCYLICYIHTCKV